MARSGIHEHGGQCSCRVNHPPSTSTDRRISGESVVVCLLYNVKINGDFDEGKNRGQRYIDKRRGNHLDHFVDTLAFCTYQSTQ
jgi:hypothetical protein